MTQNKKARARQVVVGNIRAMLLLAFALLVSGCYIPGIGGLGEADDPPGPGGVSGVSDTYYGMFYVYQVGGGEIYDLGGIQIDYMVGDEVYFPSNNFKKTMDYNINRVGNEPELTFNYRDTQDISDIEDERDAFEEIRPASSRPEGAFIGNSLVLFYTNSRRQYPTPPNWGGVRLGEPSLSAGGTDKCGADIAGSSPATAEDLSVLGTNVFIKAAISFPYDRDVFILRPAAGPVVVKTRFDMLEQNLIDLKPYDLPGPEESLLPAGEMIVRPRLKLSLLDASGNPIAGYQSSSGVDFWRWREAELTFHTNDCPGGVCYVMVEDITGIHCQDKYNYWLIVDTTINPDGNWIMKGEMKPSRSGNPLYVGENTFEPDDLSTVMEDLWPDCDGVPGSGDEGDAGIFEDCGGYHLPNTGYDNGNMQYQEVDDKTTIDDGEYFVGRPTNVPATMDSEVSIVKTPDQNTLLMFINHGSRIYMLESLDGEVGLIWNTYNVINDFFSVAPLNVRATQMPVAPVADAPVVSSGKLGFCETVPASGDWFAETEMYDRWTIYGDTAGTVLKSPMGFPHAIAVTFGGNNHLDSTALVDMEDVNRTYITSGPDGIVNTFFAPRKVVYSEFPELYLWTVGQGGVIAPEPRIYPNKETISISGPGRADNPAVFSDVAGGYVYPLAGATIGGDNKRAYLYGDDMWNAATFTSYGATLYPATYMRNQNCSFYSIGDNFDKCAMGVPWNVAANEEPVAIESGSDNRLDTVEEVMRLYRGDDRLCYDPAMGSTVAICRGGDRKFGWKDIYIPLQGDDTLEIVYDSSGVSNNIMSPVWAAGIAGGQIVLPAAIVGEPVVGIGPGPNGILETVVIDSYTTIDINEWKMWIGGDHKGAMCQTLDGFSAICPGTEAEIDMYSVKPVTWAFSSPAKVRRTHKLMTLWPMYVNSPSIGNEDYMFREEISFWPAKRDLYSVYDDEFCIVNGDIGICPGENGRFQSYPLFHRIMIDADEDLFNLYDRAAGVMGQDCYTMVSELYLYYLDAKPRTRYVLYQDFGLRQDDMIKWDQARKDQGRGGFKITTGPNGINQSCVAPGDNQLIGFNKGLPYQPIINGGANGLQTYPLADEKIYYGDGVYKISSGADGVANSYALGDDKLDILFGTGKPDHPCVRSGIDGIANTTAQHKAIPVGNLTSAATPIWANDRQLYEPGEYTGFDAFQVFGPEAVVMGSQIMLYYSALGWEQTPDEVRPTKGALAELGECHRPGIDGDYGQLEINLEFHEGKKEKEINQLVRFDRTLDELRFRKALDNDQGVVLAPRIGLATADMSCLRANAYNRPAYLNCWNYNSNRGKPVLGLSKRCGKWNSSAIDISGFSLSGPRDPDLNWLGAFSPDIITTEAPDGENTLFLMFFTGLYARQSYSIQSQSDARVGTNQHIALARSLNGVQWEVVSDISPVIQEYSQNLDVGEIFPGWWDTFKTGNPTVVNAGTDEFGDPMYGMFFNQFQNRIEIDSDDRLGMNDAAAYDNRSYDHIGYALRKGRIYFFCSIASGFFFDDHEQMRALLQMAIIAIPLVLILSIRLFRRERV